MKLSRRDVFAQQETKENMENIGSTRVTIEPSNAYVDKAVNLLEKSAPEVLKEIANIRTDLNKDVYGEYISSEPHTVHLNMKKIEQEVRSKLGQGAQEDIEQEIVRQSAIVLSHEMGHLHAYTQSKDSSENPAEQKEKEVAQRIDNNGF